MLQALFFLVSLGFKKRPLAGDNYGMSVNIVIFIHVSIGILSPVFAGS